MDWSLGASLLVYAAPVAFAALGENVVQKGGVINIGLEGSMLSAAFCGMLAASATGNPWVGLVAAIAAGLLANLVFGWFSVTLGSDQVVVGTAMNLLALGVTSTLYRAQFGQSGRLVSVPQVPEWPLILLLLASAPLLWWLLSRTKWGLALRAAGEYPRAAEAAGFSVARLRLQSIALGGIYAGLSGGFLALAIAGSFSENMTAGRGFVAIAVVTFGRWKPLWVMAAALGMGFVESLQFRFQSAGWNLPFQLFIALPYLVALAVLIVMGRGAQAPAALAQTYRREK